MKFLAIRGTSLASLAGELEIDVSRGPLADADASSAAPIPTSTGADELRRTGCEARR